MNRLQVPLSLGWFELFQIVLQDFRGRHDDAEGRAKLMRDHRHEVGLELPEFLLPRERFQQLSFRILSLRNVMNHGLNDLAPTPLDASQDHFNGNLSSLWVTANPVEARGTSPHALLHVARREHFGRSAA